MIFNLEVKVFLIRKCKRPIFERSMYNFGMDTKPWSLEMKAKTWLKCMLKYECSSPSVTVNIGISSVTLKSASWSWVILPNSRSELIIIHRFLLPVAYPRLISLICFLFCFTNSIMENMREIEKCKAWVQDVEVPLEVFEWVLCFWFPCKLIITADHYN